MQVNLSTSSSEYYTLDISKQAQKTQSMDSTYQENQSKLQVAIAQFSTNNFTAQATTSNTSEIDSNTQEFQKFLKDIGYNGKNISELSQDEAKKLVSEDGFFGVAKTAQRIADFVINGAGSNENLLRAGRSGILQGFDDAQKLWGGKLPDIAQQTIDKATQLIDNKMADLGYSVLNTTA
jgi:hypothetical protein